MNRANSSESRLFNTPFDLGLRSLFLLSETERQLDLQTLVYLDYFLVHSGDIQDGPTSLHPNTPFRAGEILVKRKLMRDGLKMMHLKQLIDVVPKEGGIYYSGNRLTKAFLQHYTARYAAELKKRAQWLRRKFARYDETKLKNYVDANLEKWGAEFITPTEEKDIV